MMRCTYPSGMVAGTDSPIDSCMESLHRSTGPVTPAPLRCSTMNKDHTLPVSGGRFAPTDDDVVMAPCS